MALVYGKSLRDTAAKENSAGGEREEIMQPGRRRKERWTEQQRRVKANRRGPSSEHMYGDNLNVSPSFVILFSSASSVNKSEIPDGQIAASWQCRMNGGRNTERREERKKH